jgi:chromosome segregation ATPase
LSELVRIFVDMNNTPSITDRPSPARLARPRTATRPVAVPASRREALALRELLEANLHALEALHDEHRQMLDTSLRSIDGICSDLRAELRAIGNARAPWVRALSETRALLFVALRELIVGAHEAELSMHLAQQQPEAPHQRTR